MQTDVLIVGGGHGGALAAIHLRQIGYAGAILVVTDENELPYERPPLSKEYFLGTRSSDSLRLRPELFWQTQSIQFALGQRISRIDSERRFAWTSQGGQFSYHHLIWAAGGEPRRLGCDGADLAGVHVVRARAQVDDLLEDLAAARRVVVVGGGYIGLECAASLRARGLEVTIVEASDRVLARVCSEPISRFFESEHRQRGVEILLSQGVAAIEGANGRASGVRLESGQVVPADLVVVGIGITPNVSPLLAAGAAGDAHGVSVDGACRTSLPDTFAIGDCAQYKSRYAGGRQVRLESVQNAADMAVVAAATIAGQAVQHDAVPWFWSTQWNLKLQTVGLSAGADDIVVRGDVSPNGFSVVYLKDDRVIALDCVNAVRDYVQGRKLVSQAVRAPRALLGDPNYELKRLLSPGA